MSIILTIIVLRIYCQETQTKSDTVRKDANSPAIPDKVLTY
jgi:hypothetical protein